MLLDTKPADLVRPSPVLPPAQAKPVVFTRDILLRSGRYRLTGTAAATYFRLTASGSRGVNTGGLSEQVLVVSREIVLGSRGY